jgi:hypothetical protein
MNTNERDTKPSLTSNAAEWSAKPVQTWPRDQQQALLSETLALLQSGENPSRLRQLLLGLDAERLRQIDELLVWEPEQALAKLYERRNVSLDSLQPFVDAMNRTDLTTAEMNFLVELFQRNNRQLRKSLMNEKKLIERKHRPGTRSERGFI